MAYAQKNYLQAQGIPPTKYRIDQIGCFLTSFANLLTYRFGKKVDPVTLNKVFKDKRIYIDVDDGIRDDLGWQSITGYNGKIVVRKTGSTAVPPDNKSIVRIKAGNRFGTHFCLVEKIVGNTVYIVDSWDGKVKKASDYGPITGWASYKDITPQPVKPPAKPAPKPQPKPAASTGPNYDGVSITIQPGWGISHAAKAAGYPDFANLSRWDQIAKLNGHANASTFKVQAGQRIKVGRYTAPKPAEQPKPAAPAPVPPTPPETPQPAPETVIEPTQPPAEPVITGWKDGFNTETAGRYVANKPHIVEDLEGVQPSLNINLGQPVDIAGSFVKDGVKYYRTKKSAQHDWWYGLPENILTLQHLDKDDDEDDIFDMDLGIETKEFINNLKGRERIVAMLASIQGFFINLARKITRKK